MDKKASRRSILLWIKNNAIATIIAIVLGLLLALWIVFSSGKPELFTPDAASGDPVYAQITSIQPMYEIPDQNNYPASILCYCKTDSSSGIWVYMPVNEYYSNFDPDANFYENDGPYETITFKVSKRIHGVALETAQIAGFLSGKTDPIVFGFAALQK